jgi:hypothetical protein
LWTKSKFSDGITEINGTEHVWRPLTEAII